MIYALAALAAVIGLVALSSSKKMGKFTPALDDATLGNTTALILVSQPGSKDDETALSNAVFKAGLNIASLSEPQANGLGKPPLTVVRFGGKPVGIFRASLTGDLTMPLLIQARMANPNVPSIWTVLVPQAPSTFSIPGYNVIGTTTAGNL